LLFSLIKVHVSQLWFLKPFKVT